MRRRRCEGFSFSSLESPLIFISVGGMAECSHRLHCAVLVGYTYVFETERLEQIPGSRLESTIDGRGGRRRRRALRGELHIEEALLPRSGRSLCGRRRNCDGGVAGLDCTGLDSGVGGVSRETPRLRARCALITPRLVPPLLCPLESPLFSSPLPLPSADFSSYHRESGRCARDRAQVKTFFKGAT